jgi:anti-sigma factor RsiW
MPCQHYKDALIEAAATGAGPQGDLRAHLASCASCRDALAQEQSLFGAIDSGLHATANTEVPPSLLPRVRVSLDEAPAPQRRWARSLVFASASVALAFLIFLVARPRHASPEDIARLSPITVLFPTAPATAANSEKTSRERAQVTDVRVSHSHAARNSTNLHSVASSNPEVLVPSDEREAFARFLSRDRPLAERDLIRTARAPEPPQESVEILPVEIASLTVKPLNKDEDDGQKTDF